MKIAIPTANGKLCMHFGHCNQFALVEVNDDGKSIVKTDYLTPPPTVSNAASDSKEIICACR